MVKFIIEQLKILYRKSIIIGAACCVLVGALFTSGTLKGEWFLAPICFGAGWFIFVGWFIEEIYPVFQEAHKKLQLRNKTLSDKVAEVENSFGVK